MTGSTQLSSNCRPSGGPNKSFEVPHASLFASNPVLVKCLHMQGIVTVVNDKISPIGRSNIDLVLSRVLQKSLLELFLIDRNRHRQG